MSGFANSILGGASNLIRKAIQSPNFITGISGWSIFRNGSAEFNSVTIRGGVVISGTALYYSGSGVPAAGALVASIAAAGGTDTVGNAYLAGIVNYVGPFATQLDGGAMAYLSAPSQAGPWTSAGNIDQAVLSGFTGLRLQGINGVLFPELDIMSDGASSWVMPALGTALVHANPVTGVPETWHLMAALLGAGYAAGTPVPEYRMNNAGNVELAGQVIGTGVANLSTVATLPASWFSGTNAFRLGAVAMLAGAAAPIAGQNFHLNLTTGGALQLAGLSAGGNYTFALDGIIAPISRG